jgi:hypothetical protein
MITLRKRIGFKKMDDKMKKEDSKPIVTVEHATHKIPKKSSTAFFDPTAAHAASGNGL